MLKTKSRSFLSMLLALSMMFPFYSSNAAATKIQTQAAVVSRVVDGDTVEVKIKEKSEKVRFIGINCPESTIRQDPYGKEASNYTKKQLTGKTVYLQKDVSDRDKYGRLLRYVWLKQPVSDSESEVKAKMYNANLVLNGYAQASTYVPDVKYSKYFVKFQTTARNTNKGLWNLPSSKNSSVKSETSKNLTSTVYVTKTGEKYHRSNCKSLAKSKIKINLSDAKKKGYNPCKICKP